jgi:hypothetical protein
VLGVGDIVYGEEEVRVGGIRRQITEYLVVNIGPNSLDREIA